ncbi:hypothetical protein E1265_10540 [Streptomyces sp. 8K308]|uniref:hypothetical protein n=1 Tax=Streptomyces sp. 8K308 TaxID=2530388 RepID=UPI0010530FD9|nr:hypothetical protein [Streptomyces sp. 8K308]TDC24193.1 hypothetical protein E1265_10540 [Streptomyces sp. 8K308]
MLVAQGPTLSEVETATGAVRRTATVEGTSRLASDPARGTVWSAGSSGSVGGNLLRRVEAGADAASSGVCAGTRLPDGTLGFLEVDPATGELWVGVGSSVVIHDAGATPLAGSREHRR